MPAHLILISQDAIHRHNKGLEMPLLKQCFHLNGLKIIQELQKRSLDLRRDRYKFGRNKIIRERERNLSNCWNAFHSKASKWTSLFFSEHDKFADPRSSSWVYCIINWLMNEHKIVSNSNWFDKLIEFNLKGNLEGIQKHILSVFLVFINRAQYNTIRETTTQYPIG